MSKNPILDIIISILNNETQYTHEGKTYNKIECVWKNRTYGLWNPNYLLNQIIRQYAIPAENFFVSQKALDLWNNLSDKDIWDFSYRDKIVCRSKAPISVKKYKGACSDFEEIELKDGSEFIFNDIFHDEHAIPINTIIKELKKLTDFNYESVSKILNEIRICRILKEEDRRIKERISREFDFEKIKNDIYGKYDIILKARQDGRFFT